MLLNPDDVKSRNLPGSVGAATMNDKLYAYPMTADNGYFLYYDASILSAEDVQSVEMRRLVIKEGVKAALARIASLPDTDPLLPLAAQAYEEVERIIAKIPEAQ